MLDVKTFAEQILVGDVCVAVQSLETVVLQFHIEFVPYDAGAGNMTHAEVLFQLLLDFLILLGGPVDGLGHALALSGILFQFSGQLYADFIRLSVSIDDPVYNVDHLVEDFLYNGISQ